MAKKKKWPVVYKPDPEAWMTTFADLVSLMLTFFILLVSMSTLDNTGLQDISTYFKRAVSVMNSGDKTEINIIPPSILQRSVSPQELMLAMRQNSHVVLRDSALEHKVKGIIIKDRLYLRMSDVALFDKGSAKLKPETIKVLRRLARMLAVSPGKISVNGHSDGRAVVKGGKYPDPWSLTLARSASVLHIMEEEGVNPARLSLAGYGPSKPISTDSTPFGRSHNRRVDIVVYK
ncbi:MAG: flagellar motor protein MotB [Mariprofundaceae bacterium]|nr:flagellar motor protein MotB [Mariprofundaceae bacterium]